jgi:ADP-ribose diphosphatase
MRKPPEVLHSEVVARSRIFRVEERHLRFSNGTEVHYERLLSGPTGAVLVVPMLDDETVLLIREYAGGTHRYELGLPKGLVNKDEDILDAANRELQEETGYAAKQLQELAVLSVAPGYLSHVTRIVLARDLFEQRLEGDEPEEIEVVPWPLANISSLLTRDDFSEARSLAALYLTRDFLHNDS